MEVFIQRVKAIIALPFFSCALLMTSCCRLNHLSADDETSNVLKRSVKDMFAHVLALCLHQAKF